ncbi:hypothetical protein [Candidatus Contubernalis alkaliaceticus]|uniref:hypothetical protein n=1 Tax=Candidatus Contubernalis alkaliaceticus TaxID=338645 RepID=UPI001F4C055F|nr:hypothetical protein [Candidatus Contubernalis alkalaceticus]UNC92806.1 hypothetical protein HUE98_12290 [Candidatus Contubernalis alkalaceticus]
MKARQLFLGIVLILCMVIVISVPKVFASLDNFYCSAPSAELLIDEAKVHEGTFLLTNKQVEGLELLFDSMVTEKTDLTKEEISHIIISNNSWQGLKNSSSFLTDLNNNIENGKTVIFLGVPEKEIFSNIKFVNYEMVTPALVPRESGKITAIRRRAGGTHIYTGAIDINVSIDQFAVVVQDIVDYMTEEAYIIENSPNAVLTTQELNEIDANIGNRSFTPGTYWTRSNTTRTLERNYLTSLKSRSYSQYYYATVSGTDYWVNVTNRSTEPVETHTRTRQQQTLHWTSTSYTGEKNGPTTEDGPSTYSYTLGLSGSGLSFSLSGNIPDRRYVAEASYSLRRFGGYVEHNRSSSTASNQWEMDSGWRITKGTGNSIYIQNMKHYVLYDINYALFNYELWSGSHYIYKN